MSYAQQQRIKPANRHNLVNSKQIVSKSKAFAKNTKEDLGKKEKKKIGIEDNKSNALKSEINKSNKKDGTVEHDMASDLMEFRSQVKVILSDGREVTGRLSLQVPKSIHFKHTKRGIQYYKIIRIQDISHIEFKAWKSRFIKAKKMGKIYRFSVSNYTVKLKNGQVLEQTGNALPFLEELLLSNTNGNVRLYSYWIDLYNKNERWHTGIQGPVEGKRFLAHADVIKRIILFEQKSN